MVPHSGSFLNILVVDDEANIRRTLSICLETEGHQVAAVSSPEDALSEASRRMFDIAFFGARRELGAFRWASVSFFMFKSASI